MEYYARVEVEMAERGIRPRDGRHIVAHIGGDSTGQEPSLRRRGDGEMTCLMEQIPGPLEPGLVNQENAFVDVNTRKESIAG